MGIAAILRAKGAYVVTVAPETPIESVVELLVEHRIGAVLVLQGESLVGVLSERDLVRGLRTNRQNLMEMRAADLMTKVVETISPEESVANAMEKMTNRRIRHLPVQVSGRIVGIVSIGDLVKRRIEEVEREANQLKDYIAAG
ncbi:MAG: CBS domain-containing protein [Sphingomonadaceae bacterium]